MFSMFPSLPSFLSHAHISCLITSEHQNPVKSVLLPVIAALETGALCVCLEQAAASLLAHTCWEEGGTVESGALEDSHIPGHASCV